MHDNLTPLAALDDWKLEHSSQDLRGQTLMGPDGRAFGTVEEMLVDRDRERVAAVTLSDGRTVPVEQIAIRDDGIFFKQEGMANRSARTEGNEQRIPIIEEEIKIGKRTVESGGVRAATHVVEEPFRETVNLHQEHVDIERRPVSDGRIADRTADELLKDQTVEMRARSEEAVVGKEARVKEELVIRKSTDQRQEEVTGTTRHTEVDVEKLDGNEHRNN